MKHISLIIVLFTTHMVVGQKLTQEQLKVNQLNTHKKIVNQALRYNDIQTAINSMHYIVALEGDTSTYKDSLAITYYKVGNYVSSHVLSKELLIQQPKNIQLMEINAMSLQNLGAIKDAIAAYETLFAQTNTMFHGYQLANLQYSLKRLSEAKATIAQTLQCDKMEAVQLQFPVDKTKNQNVPLLAAAYNLQGLIAFELKDHNTASIAFKDALKIMPKFTVATQNANAVVVAMQQTSNKKRNVNN